MGIYINNNPFAFLFVVLGLLALYTVAAYVYEWVIDYRAMNSGVVDNPIHYQGCPAIFNTMAVCSCVIPSTWVDEWVETVRPPVELFRSLAGGSKAPYDWEQEV